MTFRFNQNQVIHGFRVLSVAEDTELNARCIRMIHEKTGADLFWLDNGAENMVFSVSFRTLPQDSSGVFHILEHSVLCGSREYPVREPFVELLKSSMNTFLNAMTFPDMTMFPVSSRNFRDLMNLTRVYLDAVFHPIVLKDKKRFCQEGWHIDRDENGNPEFRGVVYNEMKGAMSDPDTLMERQVVRQLFPDTCYGYNSGGDPEEITGLSWDLLRKQYRSCYHPSNAYIYLDGGIDPDEMLEEIDRSFVGFSRRIKRSAFRYQTPKGSEATIHYEIGPEEEIKDHGHMTMARITGTWKDRTENLARSIICDVLTGNNESPLKHAALERGLCRDLNISVDDTGLQSWISIHADNVMDGKEKEIRDLIEETGNRIAEKGLNRDAVEASMNRLIFNMREDEEPQGISRCIRIMSTWLYGGDPVDALHTQTLIRELREMAETGMIDKIAVDMLLNRNNMVILHTLPSRTIGEEKRREEQTRIQEITGSWTETDQKENEKENDELRKWQESPDPGKAIKKLPMLTRADAAVLPEWTKTEEWVEGGIRIMRHMIPCNGVVYLRLYFPLTGFSLEELTKASLFAGMLGRLPTVRHDAFSLQQEIRRHTGGLGFAVITRSSDKDGDSCVPYLTAYVSALEEKADTAARLLNEILTQTIIEGQEDRIRDIMSQNETGARQRAVNAGHMVAVKSALSRYSAENAVRNALDGEPAIRYVHRYAVMPDKETEGFVRTAHHVMEEGVAREGAFVSVTGKYNPELKLLLDGIPEKSQKLPAVTYRCMYPRLLGYRIPSQVGFTARGYRLNQCGKKFSGIVWLACSILSLEYLWNLVRVQGGSYGAGFQADRNGNIFSYSYRDPAPRKTLGADFGASAFLKAFAAKEEKLDKYIISSLNELNPLLSPREKSALADSRRMSGITREETERIRVEILSAKGKDLIQCGEWLDRFAEEGSICIAGPENILETWEEMVIREL